eukprot:11431-Heterococcus_DN1.PRE.2
MVARPAAATAVTAATATAASAAAPAAVAVAAPCSCSSRQCSHHLLQRLLASLTVLSVHSGSMLISMLISIHTSIKLQQHTEATVSSIYYAYTQCCCCVLKNTAPRGSECTVCTPPE